MAYVLVHSPLLGPGSWTPVARQLRERGHVALNPDLTPGLDSPTIWQAQADIVADAIPDSPDRAFWIVAHSGAGPLLPAIKTRLASPPAGYLLVDAAMPHPNHTRLEMLPQDLAVRLRALTDDGVLPPWHEWFGEDIIELLLPNPDVRERFIGDVPRVPLRLFEERLPENRGWPNAPGCFLRLSQAYLEESVKAVGLGFRAAVIDGDHLSIVTRSSDIAEAMLRLAGPAH